MHATLVVVESSNPLIQDEIFSIFLLLFSPFISTQLKLGVSQLTLKLTKTMKIWDDVCNMSDYYYAY